MCSMFPERISQSQTGYLDWRKTLLENHDRFLLWRNGILIGSILRSVFSLLGADDLPLLVAA